MEIITFNLTQNVHVWAAGQLGHRPQCIPMGGSFSAYSADLHSAWGVYQGRHLFRELGWLEISDEGYVSWVKHHGIVSMCQFTDRILLASTYPDFPQIRLVIVCNVLQACWGHGWSVIRRTPA